MSGRVVKVVIFVLMTIMIATMATALLDPGLGKPDDKRRTRHPAGFSIAYPLGWGGTPYGGSGPNDGANIRLAQERKTGRETTINVECFGDRAKPMPDAKEGTFQGQPAFYSTGKSGRGWQWSVQFQRNEVWYSIQLISPIELEVQKSPYWPYIESFRVESRLQLSEPSTLPAMVPSH